jgi:hypothetical protein
MAVIDDDHLMILYDGQKELYFEKIALEELIGKAR